MGWILGSSCSSMADICNINSLSRNLSDLFFGHGVSVMAPIILIILQQNTYGKDSLASIIVGYLRIPQITKSATEIRNEENAPT